MNDKVKENIKTLIDCNQKHLKEIQKDRKYENFLDVVFNILSIIIMYFLAVEETLNLFNLFILFIIFTLSIRVKLKIIRNEVDIDNNNTTIIIYKLGLNDK